MGSGDKFLSASYDRSIKMWDTETGDVIGRFSNKKMAFCAKFNPCDDKQHLIVAGTSSNKIVCWDVRSGGIVQEYDRHLAAVNTITFVDRNRRFVTTSDDKSMRVWEWNIPVDMKYIADPSMHSMPAVTAAPNGKWIACQSLDNKISVPGGGQVQGDEEESVQGPYGGRVCMWFGLQPRDVISGKWRWRWKGLHLGLEDNQTAVKMESS